MIRFFKKLFKRGDFMTRADKAYYKYRAKTIFWSAFCLIIISWVGTNLVLCALTTNVKSGGDIVYEVPRRSVILPKGDDLNKQIKQTTSTSSYANGIKKIVFDYYQNYSDADGDGVCDIFFQVDPEIVSLEDDIKIYRVNNGSEVYVMSHNNMLANENSSYTFTYLSIGTDLILNNYFFTSNVKLMANMFTRCYLKSWEFLSNFDTSNVTDMYYLFMWSNINDEDQYFKDWDVSSVTSLDHTFGYYDGTVLDISGWDTSNVTTMSHMFYQCYDLITIYVGPKFTTRSLSGQYSSTNMFASCKSLVGGHGQTWSSMYTDATRAHTGTSGYLTLKTN